MAILRNPYTGDDPDVLDEPEPPDLCKTCGDRFCNGGEACPVNQTRYEREGRAAKVRKLLVVLPLSRSEKQREILLVALGSFSRAGKAWLAKKAGVRIPSALTWSALIDAVRVRPLRAEIDRIDRHKLAAEIRNIAQIISTATTDEKCAIATGRLVAVAETLESN